MVRHRVILSKTLKLIIKEKNSKLLNVFSFRYVIQFQYFKLPFLFTLLQETMKGFPDT